jgi:hypothetical protein
MFLAGELIGCKRVSENDWAPTYGPLELGEPIDREGTL